LQCGTPSRGCSLSWRRGPHERGSVDRRSVG
jgi:hypothetical protein